MDSTCTPSTLIIVDVWFCPALCLEVSDKKKAELHVRHQTPPLRHFVFYQSLTEHQDQWD